MSKKNYIIPIFVPHKGCPHNCIFCNQKRITGQTEYVTSKYVNDTIYKYRDSIKGNNANIEVAFFGGSFTAIPMEEQNIYLSVAKKYLNSGAINTIRLSTRPDYIDKKILSNLKKHGVSIVELGVQSMNEGVLQTSQRGHSAKDVVNAVKLLKNENFIVGIQLMLGLPGDSKNKCIDTVKKVIDLNPDFARIYPSLVIKDTQMEFMYRSGEYKPLTLSDAVDTCKEMLVLLESNRINVIRIGLQATDEMQMGKNIIAGPYHPSFRQLVESEIYKDMITFLLESKFKGRPRKICIKTNTVDFSNVLGQRKSNLVYLNNKYPDSKIDFTISDIKKDQICVSVNEENYFLTKKEYYENHKV